MKGLFSSSEEDERLAVLLMIKRDDPQTFYEILFEMLNTADNETLIGLDDDVSLENKISSVKDLIDYFESVEDYGKCARLKEIETLIVEGHAEI